MQSMAEHYKEQGLEEGLELGIEQGETRTKREYILKLLQLRFDNVPEPLVETIRSLDDRNWLETLFEKAVTTQTLEELRTEVDALAEDKKHSENSE